MRAKTKTHLGERRAFVGSPMGIRKLRPRFLNSSQPSVYEINLAEMSSVTNCQRWSHFIHFGRFLVNLKRSDRALSSIKASFEDANTIQILFV